MMRFFCSTTMAFVILGSGCGSKAPSEEVLQRHRWVTSVDPQVMAYACPELQRKPLGAEDPLKAATIFVQRGRQLEGFATDESNAVNPEPKDLAASLDSLQIAIGVMARGFGPAVAMAALYDRECYGSFALNCNKLIRARNVISRIDGFAMRQALSDYLRHRAALAKAFEREGAPLDALATCREDPPRAG